MAEVEQKDYRHLSYGLPNPHNYVVKPLPRESDNHLIFPFLPNELKYDLRTFRPEAMGNLVTMQDAEAVCKEIDKIWHSYKIFEHMKSLKKKLLIAGIIGAIFFLILLFIGVGVMQASTKAGAYMMLFSGLGGIITVSALVCTNNTLPHKLNEFIKKTNKLVDKHFTKLNSIFIEENKPICWIKGQNMNWIELVYGRQDQKALQAREINQKIENINNADIQNHYAFQPKQAKQENYGGNRSSFVDPHQHRGSVMPNPQEHRGNVMPNPQQHRGSVIPNPQQHRGSVMPNQGGFGNTNSGFYGNNPADQSPNRSRNEEIPFLQQIYEVKIYKHLLFFLIRQILQQKLMRDPKKFLKNEIFYWKICDDFILNGSTPRFYSINPTNKNQCMSSQINKKNECGIPINQFQNLAIKKKFNLNKKFSISVFDTICVKFHTFISFEQYLFENSPLKMLGQLCKQTIYVIHLFFSQLISSVHKKNFSMFGRILH